MAVHNSGSRQLGKQLRHLFHESLWASLEDKNGCEDECQPHMSSVLGLAVYPEFFLFLSFSLFLHRTYHAGIGSHSGVSWFFRAGCPH